MQSKAVTVAAYLAELPPDRRKAITAIREVLLKNLPKGLEEGMQYGMIGFYVPHSIYPAGYHADPKQPLPFACLASQKNYISLYLMSLYADDGQLKWLQQAWSRAGKKLDMGKSCIRFKSLDDAPLAIIGQAIKRVSLRQHIAMYEAIVPAAKRAARKSATARKAIKKQPATKSPPKRKAAAKPAAKKQR
jgi:hypothetical protein